MKKIACVAVLLFSSALLAEDIAVEAKVKGCVAALVATTDGKTVAWVPITPGLTQPFPSDFFATTKHTAFTGAPGTYKVLAITSIKDEPKYTEVTFTIEGPPVPPPPPAPPDTLIARTKEAYLKDPSPAAKKSERAAQLVGLYTVAVKVADDPTLLTVADFTREVSAAKARLGIEGDDVLRDCRVIFAQEMVSAIGPSTSTAPLNREAAKVVCTRIADSLKKVNQ